MVELKDTLLMPNTKFPMRGNLPNKEPQFLQRWEEMDLYNKILEKNAGKPSYVLHDGPPYANGNIHIGHALNKILKDFIVKYKNMNGFVSPYVPGWDTHGLPIEQVLVNNGVDRKSMPANKFRNKCKDYALKNKYGKDLSLPAYEEILSLEQPEEYADVKSKAPTEQ